MKNGQNKKAKPSHPKLTFCLTLDDKIFNKYSIIYLRIKTSKSKKQFILLILESQVLFNLAFPFKGLHMLNF